MHYRTVLLSTAMTAGFAIKAEAQDWWSRDYGGYNFVRPGGFVWGPEIGLVGLSNSGCQTDATLGTSDFEGSFC